MKRNAQKSLHVQLRETADENDKGHLWANTTRLMRAAAAEIEGHNEAFATVVDHKTGLKQELEQSQRNHRGTLDFIVNWRELLVALAHEHPNDIRITRALAGENPFRPAPWERK